MIEMNQDPGEEEAPLRGEDDDLLGVVPLMVLYDALQAVVPLKVVDDELMVAGGYPGVAAP